MGEHLNLNYLTGLKEKAIAAIGKHLPFLWCATFFTTINDTIFNLAVDNNYAKAFIVIGSNFAMAFAMTLIIILLEKIRLGGVVKYLTELIIALYFALLLVCWTKFGDCLGKDMIALINGTNPNETNEFFETHIGWPTIVLFVIAALVAFAIQIYFTRKPFQPKKKHFIGTGILLLLCTLCLGFSFYTIPGRINAIFRTEKKNLADYLQHPVMVETNNNHPDIVMVIIGESFAKYHSSIYGYEKNTSPKLQARIDSLQIVAFKNAVSPATHTADAFKLLMTEFTNDTTDKDWWECLTLPEAINCSKYTTSWFSNQTYTGWHDNVSSSFADLCNYSLFISRDEKLSTLRIDDMNLVPLIKNYLADNDKRQFVFVNLMGQHVNYQDRYTPEYDIFKAKDYIDRPENQREILAYYDNATLYNDAVVDKMLDTVNGKDAIVLYFPDHGQDMFVSSPTYFSHSNDNNKQSYEAGIQIPFFVYATATYKEKHPSMWQTINSMKDKPFNTENLMPLALNIIGYERTK